MKSVQQQKKSYLYALAVVGLWATVASAFKISLRHVDYFQLVLYSSLVSTLAFFLMIVLRRRLPQLASLSRGDFLNSFLLGILNPGLYYLVLFKAYSLLPAQQAQPVNQTWVIILAVLSQVMLKQRVGPKSLVAVGISFTGVVVIAIRGQIGGFEPGRLPGLGLALASAFIWAFYWIANVKSRHDATVKLFLNFAFGTAFVFLLALATRRLAPVAWPGLCGAVYVGLFEMGVTFVLWLKALRLSATAAKVGNLIYLVPFISLVIIRAAVGEAIHYSAVLGLVLIVMGIAVQQAAKLPDKERNQDQQAG